MGHRGRSGYWGYYLVARDGFTIRKLDARMNQLTERTVC